MLTAPRKTPSWRIRQLARPILLITSKMDISGIEWKASQSTTERRGPDYHPSFDHFGDGSGEERPRLSLLRRPAAAGLTQNSQNLHESSSRAKIRRVAIQPPAANFGEATAPPRTDKLANLGAGALAPAYGPGGGTSPSQDQAMGMSDDMSLQGELAEQANGSVRGRQQDLGTETLAPQPEVHQKSRRLGCVKVGELGDTGSPIAIVFAASDPPKPARSPQTVPDRL